MYSLRKLDLIRSTAAISAFAALIVVSPSSSPSVAFSAAAAEQVTYRIDAHGDVGTVTAGYVARAPHRQQYRHLSVWDHSCDGKRAWVQYGLDGGDGEVLHPAFYDQDGCKGSAWGKDYSGQAVTVTRFRLGTGFPPHVVWTSWRATPTTPGQ